MSQPICLSTWKKVKHQIPTGVYAVTQTAGVQGNRQTPSGVYVVTQTAGVWGNSQVLSRVYVVTQTAGVWGSAPASHQASLLAP